MLRRERARIFARSWQYAGRAEQVATPGSFLATDAGGIPILVTRDAAGELRAFLNVCRHRGAVLIEGCGERATVQCHYHAWTYDLDGSLRNAPRSDREPGFDKSEWSLLPASVGTWGPFLFVNPDPDAPPLDEHLGDLPEIARARHRRRRLVFHSRVEFGANANWKIVVENFLECYHCATAHPGFSAEVDVHPDRYLLEAHATYSAQFCAAKADRRARAVPPALPEHRPERLPWAAEPLDRAGRSRTAPAAPSATSTTSSRPASTRPGAASSSRSTTRSGKKTRCSSSPCTAAWPSGVLEQGRLLLGAEPLLAAFQGWVAERLSAD